MTKKRGAKKIQSWDILETLGGLLAALSALLGIAVLAMGGTAAILLGLPVGILLMIAGSTQKTAAATVEILKLQELIAVRD